MKAVGRETLRTGGRILSNLADNTDGDVKPRHIIAKHVGDSAQTLIQNMRGKGRNRPTLPRSMGLPKRKKARPKASKLKLQKEISLHKAYQSVTSHGRGRSVGEHRVRHLRY